MSRFPITLIAVCFLLFCGSENGEERDRFIYHTPARLNSFLEQINRIFPEITYLEPVGTSVAGNTIYALTLSDRPLEAEPEPRIRITGGIHGDENSTTEVVLRTIIFLINKYTNGDKYYKDLIENRYIVFIPMMNPDGVIQETRHNANNIDLNRNFSTAWSPGPDHGDAPFSEPESAAFRDYSLFMGFHLSITYHTGAVIVNMPFDYASLHFDGIAPAEYDLVSYIGNVYTTEGRFLETENILNTEYVDNGTINGGDWYVVFGSLQDWSYIETGCIDYTIEISQIKKPDTEKEIVTLFELNRDSLIAFIESAGMGVYGKITDSGGDPVKAEITIDGGDIITASDAFGYYHRLLLPGSYSINFSAAGYQDKSEEITVTSEEEPLRLDITMAE